MTAQVTTLILPGINDSGPEHWQSRWERRDASCRRVVQDEWDAPWRGDWVARLDETVARHREPLVLVGHSSACALVAHWARQASPGQLARVRGALLVGPSDPEGPNYPPAPTGFAPVPLERLPFESIVVASDDDPYVTLERATAYAEHWGSRLVVIRGAGHINAASGLGDWDAGWALLESLRHGPAARLRHAVANAEPMLRAISSDDSAIRPAPGKWSPREVIGHLVDSASNNHQRFVRGAWQSDLVFPGYEQDGWVELQRYQHESWPDLVTLWASFNRHIATVMAAVPEEVRRRVHATHNLDEIASIAPPTPADATLEYFMSDYVWHLEHHLKQVFGPAWPPWR